MGNKFARDDYYWSYTDEPHATRRREILAKYPKVKTLFGHDTRTKYIVFWWVSSQVLMSYLLRNYSWGMIALAAYTYGAIAAHALFLAMHEISHNLAFEKNAHNKMIGVFANLATVFPHFSMFQRYHMEHHQYQGVQGIDVDIPTKLEGDIFTNTVLKFFWVVFQALGYIFRPLWIKPKSPGFWEFVNWSCCLLFGLAIWQLFGDKAIGYLVLSSFLSSGLHPVAGHFIAEHYVWIKGQETYSYYGPINYVTFNVGHHNEHHDFPRIPGSRLPELRKMCPDYYVALPSHTSWAKVMYDYIVDPTVGPYSRVMRKGNKLKPAEEDYKS